MPLNEVAMPGSTCRICSRRLTRRQSMELGIGPVCRAKRRMENQKQLELFDMAELKARRPSGAKTQDEIMNFIKNNHGVSRRKHDG